MKQKLTGNTIIFDWGNTLVLDPFEDLLPKVCDQAAKIAKQKFNIKLDASAFSKSWRDVNNNMQFQYASHFSQEEPFIQEALSKISIAADIRALFAPEILSLYRQNFKTLLELNPRNKKIKETLVKLKVMGKRFGIISNDRKFTARATLKWMKIDYLFDHFLPSEEIEVEKPDPKVFEIASKRFKTLFSDIIYVGDDLIKDIQCAHRAGVKVILYIPPQKYRTANSWRNYSGVLDKPDATINNIKEILNVVS